MDLSILHHLGLGDHIVCHGIVRHFAEKGPVTLFCKHHNRSSVSAMYTDLPVTTIPVKDHEEALFIQKSLRKYALHLIVHDSDPEINKGLSFDEIFFKKAEVPFLYKWEKFFIPRNISKEIEAPSKPYAVIHQDERYKINVNTDLPIYEINRGLSNNVFDFRAILDNAEECHVIDSAVMFIIDQLKCSGKKFVHRYARPNPAWQLPKLTSDWTIL